MMMVYSFSTHQSSEAAQDVSLFLFIFITHSLVRGVRDTCDDDDEDDDMNDDTVLIERHA